MDSKLADQIYYRTIEEPLSFLDDDVKTFSNKGQVKKSSMKWRINKTLRDSKVLLNQDIPFLLFGLGQGGYSEIGEVEFRGYEIKRYSSHNFYTNFVAERGIIGLILFLSFLLMLLYTGIKRIKEGRIEFSLVYLVLFLFINSFGASVSLDDEFGYILFGSIIADIFQSTNIDNDHIEVFD